MWSWPLPASGGHDPGQVGKPGQQRPDCTLQPRQLLSQATVPVLGTPAAANFLPRTPFVPQTPHTPLYSAPHKQGPLGVTTPPHSLPFTQHPFSSPSPSLLPSHQALWIQPPFPLPFSIPTHRAQGPPPPTGLTCGERLGQKEKGPPLHPWG